MVSGGGGLYAVECGALENDDDFAEFVCVEGEFGLRVAYVHKEGEGGVFQPYVFWEYGG